MTEIFIRLSDVRRLRRAREAKRVDQNDNESVPQGKPWHGDDSEEDDEHDSPAEAEGDAADLLEGDAENNV